MFKFKLLLFTLIIGFFVSACNSVIPQSGIKVMEGMGPGSGMMGRHHASIPEPYSGMTNPVAVDEESLDRGEAVFVVQCATCHGDGGMGDGPAGTALDPAPAPVAHTSQMLGDDYLFWRISEGGMMSPFNSTMPGFKGTMKEQARWDTINYMRALGSGKVTPKKVMGGETYSPEFETATRAKMLAQAVEQAILTQKEADVFNQVHTAMDELIANEAPMSGGMGQMQEKILAKLVESDKITQAQADVFNTVHTKLLETGLMQ